MKDSQCTTCQALSAELSRWESVRQQVEALPRELDNALGVMLAEKSGLPGVTHGHLCEMARLANATVRAAVLRSFPTPEPRPFNVGDKVQIERSRNIGDDYAGRTGEVVVGAADGLVRVHMGGGETIQLKPDEILLLSPTPEPATKHDDA